MPAISNVSLTGTNLDIDGVLSGYKWTSASLTYSFPTKFSFYGSGYDASGFSAMNSTQIGAVRAILQMYSSYTNLTFTEVTESSKTHATIRFAEENNAGTAYGYYPSNDKLGYGGDAWFNHTDYNTPLKGTYAYASFMHEIGHTLGLDHGQDGLAALPYDHDSLEYSIMTYRSFVGADLDGYTTAEGSFPTTLMQDDIAAMQYMYGANYNTNSGNTTYTWNSSTGAMSINGTSQGASVTNTIFMTIWDGGGTDTYDLSNYSTNLHIDLRPGEWTTTSQGQLASLGFDGEVARGNIANALLYNSNIASLIENAKGGSGSDTITGNQVNNVLDGGGGADRLIGGLGNDTIIGGTGVDTCVIGVNYVECTVVYSSITHLFTMTSAVDGVDTISGVEYFEFLDQTIAATGFIPPDLTAPSLSSISPADNAGNVAKSANLVLTFDETVLAGSGSIVIHNADSTVFATIASNSGLVAINGSVVTINPSSDFVAGSSYYVTVDGTAFTDEATNAFTGIASDTVFNFTVPVPVSVINGTSKANTLTGTSGDDTINGLAGNDKIDGKAGNDTIDGGAGNDTMTGGAGDDTFIVDSTKDVVKESSGGGTDLVRSSVTFTIAANVENLTLTGSSAISGTGNTLNNVITGNSGANTLSGGAGDDTLFGGAGKDTLTGGTGKDYFVFDSSIGSSNLDRITDFSVVDDTIRLDNSVFTAFSADGAIDASQFTIGSSAANANIKLFYNSTSGALFYDADGNGNGAAVQIATLAASLALTSADFFII